MTKKNKIGSGILTSLFSVISFVWLIPIFAVAMNSFKSNGAVNTNPFAWPDAESFMGW